MKLKHFSFLFAAVAISTLSSQLSSADHSFRQVALSSTGAISVETAELETTEIVLVDGSSVMVAPNGLIRVAAGSDGRPNIDITVGLLRVSSNRGATVVTPHAKLDLSAGSVMIEVSEDRTRTHLLSGRELRITNSAGERVLFRPGFEVVATRSSLSRATRMSRGAVAADLERLSVGLSDRTRPSIVGDRQSNDETTEDDMLDVGLDLENSESRGLSSTMLPDLDVDSPLSFENEDSVPDGGEQGPPPDGAPPSPPGPEDPPGVMEVAFGLDGDVGSVGTIEPSIGAPAGTVYETQSSLIGESVAEVNQNTDFAVRIDEEGQFRDFPKIYRGPRSNRLFGVSDLSPSLEDLSDLGSLSELIGYHYSDNPPDRNETDARFKAFFLSTDSGLSIFPPFDFPEDQAGQILLSNLNEGLVEAISINSAYLNDSSSLYKAVDVVNGELVASRDFNGFDGFSIPASGTTFDPFPLDQYVKNCI